MLSGGGSLGAVQVGMLRALVEAGIRPDLVIGVSVGAINGAGFAADPTLRGVARMERIWRRLSARNPDVMPAGLMPLAVQLARKGQALHDPARLEELLRAELPALDFGELRVPFQCAATDLQAAEEHWFTDGPLLPALMASASLPAVYPAREVDGRILIDGGVLHEVHTHRAVALGATELYVLHVGHLSDRPYPVVRPFDSAMRAYWTARRFRLAEDLASVPDRCTLHVLPAGDTPRLRVDDFSRSVELIETAYAATLDHLDRRVPAAASAGVGRRPASRAPAAGRREAELTSAGLPAPDDLAFAADDPADPAPADPAPAPAPDNPAPAPDNPAPAVPTAGPTTGMAATTEPAAGPASQPAGDPGAGPG